MYALAREVPFYLRGWAMAWFLAAAMSCGIALLLGVGWVINGRHGSTASRNERGNGSSSSTTPERTEP